MNWIALLTTGCFISLASLANGTFPPPKAVTSAEKRAMAARKVQPVVLTMRVQTLKQRDKALAGGLRVVDIVAEDAEKKRGNPSAR
jgi:hypothetical protein